MCRHFRLPIIMSPRWAFCNSLWVMFRISSCLASPTAQKRSGTCTLKEGTLVLSQLFRILAQTVGNPYTAERHGMETAGV